MTCRSCGSGECVEEKKKRLRRRFFGCLAEAVRFELTEGSHPRRFSRPEVAVVVVQQYLQPCDTSFRLPLAKLPKGLRQPEGGHDNYTVMHRHGQSSGRVCFAAEGRRRGRGLSRRSAQQAEQEYFPARSRNSEIKV